MKTGMNRLRIGAIVMVVALLGVTGADCEAPPEGSVLVDYDVTILYGYAYLRVRVEGPETHYDILLFDPDGERVGYGWISSDDMITGHETVRRVLLASEAWFHGDDAFRGQASL